MQGSLYKTFQNFHLEHKERKKMHLHLLVGFWWPKNLNLSFDYCIYRFTEKYIILNIINVVLVVPWF